MTAQEFIDKLSISPEGNYILNDEIFITPNNNGGHHYNLKIREFFPETDFQSFIKLMKEFKVILNSKQEGKFDGKKLNDGFVFDELSCFPLPNNFNKNKT